MDGNGYQQGRIEKDGNRQRNNATIQDEETTTSCRPANLENIFRGTFRVKKRGLPAKSGTVGRAHIEIFFRSIQPTEINCRASKSPDFSGDLPIFYKIMKISRSPDLE